MAIMKNAQGVKGEGMGVVGIACLQTIGGGQTQC